MVWPPCPYVDILPRTDRQCSDRLSWKFEFRCYSIWYRLRLLLGSLSSFFFHDGLILLFQMDPTGLLLCENFKRWFDMVFYIFYFVLLIFVFKLYIYLFVCLFSISRSPCILLVQSTTTTTKSQKTCITVTRTTDERGRTLKRQIDFYQYQHFGEVESPFYCWRAVEGWGWMRVTAHHNYPFLFSPPASINGSARAIWHL